jgi:hypothetical protein
VEHVGPPNIVLVVEGGVDKSGIGVSRGGEGMRPYCDGVFKPVTEAREDCSRHVRVDRIGREDGGEGVESSEALGDSGGGGAVFMVEGGAAWAGAVKGSLATTGETMAEGGKEAKLKLVGRAAIAAETATKSFLQMGP